MTPDEIYKLKIDAAQRAHDRATEFEKSVNRDAVNTGAQTLKSLMLVNGGSCIAILTFIGTLATKHRPVSEFAHPLIAFALGAGSSVVAGAIAYFVNLLILSSSRKMTREYGEPFIRDTDQSKRTRFFGEVARWIAVAFAAFAIGCFFYGLYSAYSAFQYL